MDKTMLIFVAADVFVSVILCVCCYYWGKDNGCKETTGKLKGLFCNKDNTFFKG